ncbi:cytochrome P450 [Promicromonospora thailandica]|uniref:Cytochrome P450 n=1 Tax=Promicromonospora thailandica TaxID=765201 RepID=A0A9X2FYZ6_9MICO|nr:cytochrome P450 [Promicromonospora thailandica]MCP2263965.1 Cytochrome P450 [Promicromonospora thailandica]BFF17707.1 cytochrome P450 [Promicromonospora thailandica]
MTAPSPAPRPVRLSDVTDRTPLVATTTSPDANTVYEQLRERWGAVAPIDLEPGVPGWLVLGHSAAVGLLRDDHTFIKDPSIWNGHGKGLLGPQSGLHLVLATAPKPTLADADGAKHARMRPPVDDALEQVDEARAGAITRRLCGMLIDRFEDRGHADLVAEYAAVVPFLVLSELDGLEPGQAQRLQEITRAIFEAGADARALTGELRALVTGHIEHSRAHGTRDIAGVLAVHENFENDLERAQTLTAITAAATESLMAWVAQTLVLILSDPRFSHRVSGGRLHIDDALDEVLWRSTTNPNLMPRFAVRDVVVDDKLVARGDPVVVAVHAANHDPLVQSADPWETVGNRAYLSFGAGAHRCPAPRLGRVVARIAVAELLKRLQLTLTGDPNRVEWATSPWMRFPARLPVTFPSPRQQPPYGTWGDSGEDGDRSPWAADS